MATILVVDDEAGIRSFLREALELFGHTVDTAADGGEAWTLMQRRAYDALLTDLTMPGVNGMDLLRVVRERQPDVVALVLTAHGTVSTAVEAMKLGAFDYVEKPLGELRELRALFERALAHRTVNAGVPVVEADLVDEGTPLHFGDPVMASVADAIRRVAPTQATVLLQGESGVGKDVVARLIHRNSPRSRGAFVAINSASLSETLLESELFGHEKGAFTGAHERRRGKIEAAAGGTFFLDEVGELRPDAQARLLRVLETRTFERVGGTTALTADVRWIAATHRDLRRMVEQGQFRADLYHRLAIFPIRVPPLRERRTDLLPLARRLLAEACSALGVGRLPLTASAESWLMANPWPGNIREMRNALERAAILAAPHAVDVRHLGDADDSMELVGTAATSEKSGSLEAMEREAIRRALVECSGNRRLAAERLGIGLRTLYDKLRRYQLESLR